ncbi:FUSC family protein, partial [Streptomyces sp. ZG43]
EAAVQALIADGATRAEPLRSPAHPLADEPALTHLHGLERALAELAEPLRGTRRPALAVR